KMQRQKDIPNVVMVAGRDEEGHRRLIPGPGATPGFRDRAKVLREDPAEYDPCFGRAVRCRLEQRDDTYVVCRTFVATREEFPDITLTSESQTIEVTIEEEFREAVNDVLGKETITPEVVLVANTTPKHVERPSPQVFFEALHAWLNSPTTDPDVRALFWTKT